MNDRRVGVTPRIEAAVDMLQGYKFVADIGCDHGKLTAALLQRGACEHVIATDISEPSLEKGRTLIRHIGKETSTTFRVGDGLSVLNPYECDAIALLGMGGTLMCGILDAGAIPLMGAAYAVFQPMRAQCDIREYLFRHRYQITDDRVIQDHGRFYQIFSAVPGNRLQEWPQGFPEDFFDVGYVSFEKRDRNLAALCTLQLNQHEKRLKTARGTEGEQKLAGRISALRQILSQLNGGDNENQ